MESLSNKARRIIEPVLGTHEQPRLGPVNYSEGLRIAVNLLYAEAGVSGFESCNKPEESSGCTACSIIGVRLCRLVETDTSNGSKRL